jgi:hypothetical protein
MIGKPYVIADTLQPDSGSVGEKRGPKCQKRSCRGRGVASKCKRTCEPTCEGICKDRRWQAARMAHLLREIGGKRITMNPTAGHPTTTSDRPRLPRRRRVPLRTPLCRSQPRAARFARSAAMPRDGTGAPHWIAVTCRRKRRRRQSVLLRCSASREATLRHQAAFASLSGACATS